MCNTNTDTFGIKQQPLDGGRPEGQTTLDGGIAKPRRDDDG